MHIANKVWGYLAMLEVEPSGPRGPKATRSSGTAPRFKKIGGNVIRERKKFVAPLLRASQ